MQCEGFLLPLMGRPIRTATAPGRRLVGSVLALSTIVLCGLLLTPQTTKADHFTFIDLTEGPITVLHCSDTDTNCTTLSLAGTPSDIRATLGTCTPILVITGAVPEQPCGLIVLAPTGAITGTSTGAFGLTEGATSVLSDEFSVTQISSVGTPVTATMEFDSCTETAPNCALPVTPCPGTACAAENGATRVQVGTITWIGAGGLTIATDTIYAESDVETVTTTPEPASLILLGSGLLLAGGFLRRRLVTP